jgi:hypothetical protein
MHELIGIRLARGHAPSAWMMMGSQQWRTEAHVTAAQHFSPHLSLSSVLATKCLTSALLAFWSLSCAIFTLVLPVLHRVYLARISHRLYHRALRIEPQPHKAIYRPKSQKMASRTSTPSRSRSSSNSSSSSNTTMIDAPPQSPSRPARLRHPSHSAPSASQQTTQPDPSFSLLLSLPRELRDRIYTFALVSNSPFWWPGKAPESVLADHRNVSVNLLRANKQVYSEAADVLYAQNKFLFTHPSDCNIFRVVASPASVNIQNVYFRIREKDIRLWTSYLGSKKEERSLREDLPKLRSLWIFLRCGGLGVPGVLGGLQGNIVAGGNGGAGGGLGHQVQAVQNALGQQMHALQQQVQSLTQVMANAGAHIVGGGGGHANAGGNQIPPPPPPAPAMPFIQFAQGALGLGGHGHHHHHHPAPAIPHAHGQQNHPPNPSPLAQHLAQAQAHQQFNLPPSPPQHPGHFVNGQWQQAAQALSDPHTLYSSFLRFEREMGVESLCLNLRDVLHSSPSTSPAPHTYAGKSIERASTPSYNKPPTEVKIVCILRVPRRELERLVELYPQELSVDTGTQDARTRFRRLHGVDVSLELNGYPAVEHMEEGERAG